MLNFFTSTVEKLKKSGHLGKFAHGIKEGNSGRENSAERGEEKELIANHTELPI
jgi:hypothetical protein